MRGTLCLSTAQKQRALKRNKSTHHRQNEAITQKDLIFLWLNNPKELL